MNPKRLFLMLIPYAMDMDWSRLSAVWLQKDEFLIVLANPYQNYPLYHTNLIQSYVMDLNWSRMSAVWLQEEITGNGNMLSKQKQSIGG